MGSVKLRVNGRTRVIITISFAEKFSLWISGSLSRFFLPVNLRSRRARR